MVRLVFRPYTQVRRTICTSVTLRASTRVSSGFTLLRHSSPSFGSQHVYSYSNLSQKIMVGRWCAPDKRGSHRSVSLRLVGFPPTGSHTCWTPWSVFQDGPHGSIAPAASPRRSPRGGSPYGAWFVPRSRQRHATGEQSLLVSRRPNPC